MREINIAQNHLIPHLLRFMALDRQADLSAEELAQFNQGLCKGFSIFFGFMQAEDKLARWGRILEIIASTEPSTEGSLLTHANIPGAQNPAETTHDIFLQTLNAVLLPHITRKTTGLTFFQHEFLSFPENGEKIVFEAADHPVRLHAKASGAFSPDDLKALFNPEVFHDHTGIFIVGSSNHACAFYYKNPQWCFYDPNNPIGVAKFNTLEDFIAEITCTLGNELSIEIASFDNSAKSKIKIFQDSFNQLFNRKALDLIEKKGLLLLAKYNPEKFLEMLRQTLIDTPFREAFVKKIIENKDIANEAMIFLLASPLKRNMHIHLDQLSKISLEILIFQKEDARANLEISLTRIKENISQSRSSRKLLENAVIPLLNLAEECLNHEESLQHERLIDIPHLKIHTDLTLNSLINNIITHPCMEPELLELIIEDISDNKAYEYDSPTKEKLLSLFNKTTTPKMSS